jgi:hypothetical protein
MTAGEILATARALVAGGKGLLAADGAGMASVPVVSILLVRGHRPTEPGGGK